VKLVKNVLTYLLQDQVEKFVNIRK